METPSRATEIIFNVLGILSIVFFSTMTIIFASISLAAFIGIFTGDGAVGIFGALGGAALAWVLGSFVHDLLKK